MAAHPHLQAVLNNYTGLLRAMGRSAEQVSASLHTLCEPYGIQFAANP